MAPVSWPVDRRRFLLRGAQAAGVGLATPLVVDAARRFGLDGHGREIDLGNATLAASVPAPGIITRAQWGADERLRSGSPDYAQIKKFIVHHTATQDGSSDPAALIRAIYRHHTQSNGWNDIGYNFLIDTAGRIYEGRWARNYAAGEIHAGESTDGRGVIGAHAGGYNTGSVGIAILGTYSAAGPSNAAVESLVKLIAWFADRHGIDPAATEGFTNSSGTTVALPNVCGHRDTKSTTCPGQRFYDRLGEVRSKAALTIAGGFVGYRIVSPSGTAAHFGGARNYGDVPSKGVSTTVTGASGVPNSQGYLMVDRHGGVFAFGGAPYKGSIPGLRAQGVSIGQAEIIGVASTRSGNGYWLYDAFGGVFSFGDAKFYGSVPGLRAQGIPVGPARIVAMEPTRSGKGYWVLDEQGGIFAFGDARFFGSVPQLRNQGHNIGPARIVSMAARPGGKGYWVLDEIGGVFAFGDARYRGSVPGVGIYDPPARRIVAAPRGHGYAILTRSGAVYTFGSAPFYGRWTAPGLNAVDLAPVIHR